jgi:hypothetical protein
VMAALLLLLARGVKTPDGRLPEEDAAAAKQRAVEAKLAAAEKEEVAYMEKARATGERLAAEGKKEATLPAAVADGKTPHDQLEVLRDELEQVRTYRKALGLQMAAELQRARTAAKEAYVLRTELVLLSTQAALNSRVGPDPKEGRMLDQLQDALSNLTLRFEVNLTAAVDEVLALFDRYVQTRSRPRTPTR